MLTPALIALGFAVLFAAWAGRGREERWLAGPWLAYGLYESLMYARVLCTGECNIRVDLLLLWPLLAVPTLRALWRRYASRQPQAPGRGP